MLTCNWTCRSGETYTYEIHLIGTRFNSVPGNYIFAKEVSPDLWNAVYIGQTDDLGNRLTNHEKEWAAKQQGATHIQVHAGSSVEWIREQEEREMIASFDPPLNVEYQLPRLTLLRDLLSR